jgi:hypothetical protein
MIAFSVAAAFAFPLSLQAGGDKAKSADTGTSPSASQGASGSAAAGGSASAGASNSGAEKMFQALDKNKDGFVSREEAKGTPHDKDFAALDKNGDGKLSREEHAAAPEHANEKAATGSTSGTGDKGGAARSEGKTKY